MIDDVLETDVLVVGGGGAGARAAIEAARNRARVLIVVKGLYGRSGCTVMAEGGYNAAFGFAEEDSPQLHFEDTVKGGRFLNDQRLVEILVKEAPERLIDLEWYGAAFDRLKTTLLSQRAFGGSSARRTCHKGDRTGHEMMNALKEESMRLCIDVLEEVMVTSLLTSGGAVCGATGYHIVTGQFLLIRAKAVVLATGGGSRIYPVTTNPFQKTGDGYALAYGAGAELMDMEMVQFHPTAMVYPKSARGLLVTEAVRGEGGRLYNRKGERFMAAYDPERMELSTRDVVTRALFTELEMGYGTPEGGVYLDVSHLPDSIIEGKLSMMVRQFSDAGVDIRREPMVISPSAHHFMGGVRIDENCETSVRNLFACGEVAGGVHGANRLGGNSLAETQVFGRRAGLAASARARDRFLPVDMDRVEEEYRRVFRFTKGRGRTSVYSLRKSLEETMWKNAGIVRTGEGLRKALDDIRSIRKALGKVRVEPGRRYNLQLVHALELEGMLTTAEMMVRSALMRTESRGAHYRADYPAEDPAWVRNILVKKDMELSTRPSVVTRLKPEGVP
ncbi:MAG: fumarate reductase subunit A [Acidobacteria bacterium]|nr:fumarate reductase subunit A [Acidobacteriota bacterium]